MTNRRGIVRFAVRTATLLAFLPSILATPFAEAELRVFGNTTTIELAPVLLAARQLGDAGKRGSSTRWQRENLW
jgi:hypothetical protein